jgi:hypothetical protein
LLLLANTFGAAMGFLAPFLVNPHDATGCPHGQHLPALLYVHLVLAGMVAAMVATHFPVAPAAAAPLRPPSYSTQEPSSTLEQQQAKPALTSLGVLRMTGAAVFGGGAREKGALLLVCLSAGLLPGLLSAWSGLLAVVTSFGEDRAGWIGFYNSLAIMAGDALVGPFVDRFATAHAHRRKLMMAGLWLSVGLFACVTFISASPWHPSLNGSFAPTCALSVACNLFLGLATPIGYEIAAELTSELPETVSGGLLATVFNIGGCALTFAGAGMASHYVNVTALVALLAITLANQFGLSLKAETRGDAHKPLLT